MRIIKPGKSPPVHTCVCLRCECVFEYAEDEVKDFSFPMNGKITHNYKVFCPQCGISNSVPSTSNNWNRIY